MSRALLALCAICGALACSAVATAAPAASRGTTVIKEYDLGISVLPDRFDPCTGENDLTITFAGQTRAHVTEKVQGGLVTSAHVQFDQNGGILTNVLGDDYVGLLNFSSKTNLNNQNSNFDVHTSVAALSLVDWSVLVFDVDERLTFRASDPFDPVSGSTRISVNGCPA